MYNEIYYLIILGKRIYHPNKGREVGTNSECKQLMRRKIPLAFANQLQYKTATYPSSISIQQTIFFLGLA